jgi:hypothetical protein
LRSYSRFSRDDALVNDQLRDYWRKPAIREWAARDIIGQSLTDNGGVTTVIEHYGNLIVTANVGGTFDMRELPDLLVHSFLLYGSWRPDCSADHSSQPIRRLKATDPLFLTRTGSPRYPAAPRFPKTEPPEVQMLV